MPSVAEIDGITAEHTEGNRCFYSLACADTYRFQLMRLLSENISSALVLGYKNIFVRQCLGVKKGDFFQNVLINTMCVFDRACDKQIVEKILDLEKPIFLDGYYNFRLQALKRKWQEIAKLVFDNNYILLDRQLIFEFLQYLLESISDKVSHLTLTFEKDDFLMYDSKNNVIPSVRSLAPDPSAEEEAALNILLLKPQHISVYGSSLPSADFRQLISRLFDSDFAVVN